MADLTGVRLDVIDAGYALDIRLSRGAPTAEPGVFTDWRFAGAWVWWREAGQLEDNAPHIQDGWSSEPWTQPLAERTVAAFEAGR